MSFTSAARWLSVLCLAAFFTGTPVQANAPLKVGITPWQKGLAADDINRLYLPLLKYLHEKTGEDFMIERQASYDDAVSKIADGQVQVAMLSPEPYVKATKLNNKLDLLVTELAWNADKTKKVDSYRALMVVKKDREDLKDLASLKGKAFGLVAESSTSGYVVPMTHFKEAGIDPKTYFSQAPLLGSHPAVTDAIVDGKIDGGATWDFNLAQAVTKHGDKFRVIWTSDPIPNLCVVAHPQVSTELRGKIREALLSAPVELLKGLPAVGYVQRPDSYYDSVRKLSAK